MPATEAGKYGEICDYFAVVGKTEESEITNTENKILHTTKCVEIQNDRRADSRIVMPLEFIQLCFITLSPPSFCYGG